VLFVVGGSILELLQNEQDGFEFDEAEICMPELLDIHFPTQHSF
jgi:hypothetical protein